MATNDGKSYEQLTERIFEKLRPNTPFSSIERNVKISTPHGERQIDILLKAKVFDIEIRTIVECKDHKRKIDVKFLDGIVSMMKDVKANKAIIVSSSGFTSGARSKAKEHDVTLCVAQEALTKDWNIDIEIPIVVFEATPLGFELHSDFPKAMDADFEFYRDKMMINDKDIYSIVRDQWNNGKLVLQSDELAKQILQAELPPPHFIRDKHGNQIELKTFQVRFEYSVRAYYGNLKEIENTQLLKNLSEDKYTVFFETAPIKDYKKRFRLLPLNEPPPFDTLSFTIKTALKIDKVKGNYINLHEEGDDKLE